MSTTCYAASRVFSHDLHAAHTERDGNTNLLPSTEIHFPDHDDRECGQGYVEQDVKAVENLEESECFVRVNAVTMSRMIHALPEI